MKLLRRVSLVCFVSCAVGMVACSSSSTPTKTVTTRDAAVDSSRGMEAGADATVDVSVGIPDVHPDAIIDPKNCVSPTATSSEKGVGGYCSPGAGQCVHAGTGGTATLCSADFGAPAHEWFCTITCSATSDCGPGGGTCIQAPFAQICVPAACAGNLGDASSDVVDAGDAGDAATPHDGAIDAPHAHDAAESHDASADAHKATDAKAD